MWTEVDSENLYGISWQAVTVRLAPLAWRWLFSDFLHNVRTCSFYRTTLFASAVCAMTLCMSVCVCSVTSGRLLNGWTYDYVGLPVSLVLSVMFTVFPLSATSRFVASASPVNVTNAAIWITVTQKWTYITVYLFICQNVAYNIHSKFQAATGRIDRRMYRNYVYAQSRLAYKVKK